MSSATELFKSRTGTDIGIFGVRDAPRTWHVTTDSVNDNPIQTLRNNGVNEGDAHPWSETGAVLLGYRIQERWTPNAWVVDSYYGPMLALRIAASAPWELRGQGTVEAETVFEDLDGRPIGPPQYVEFTPDDTIRDGTIVTFECMGVDGKTKPLRLASVPFTVQNPNPFAPNLVRSVVGATRRRPVGQLTLTKVVTGFHDVGIAGASMARGNINEDPVYVNTTYRPQFYLAEPGTLMLTDVLFDPVEPPRDGLYITNPDGSTIPNTRITIVFQHNTLGWKETRNHVKIFDNGTQSVVFLRREITVDGMTYEAGQRLSETYRMQYETNMTGLLSSFGL